MSINGPLGAQLRYQTTDISRSDFLNFYHRNITYFIFQFLVVLVVSLVVLLSQT